MLDEAFTGLDARVKPRALRLVREARAGARVALLVVSQNLHELAALCDECACVAAGRLVDRGPAPDFLRPARPGAHAAAAFYLDAYWALERDMRAAAGPALPRRRSRARRRRRAAPADRRPAGPPAVGPALGPRAPARGAAVEVGGPRGAAALQRAARARPRRGRGPLPRAPRGRPGAGRAAVPPEPAPAVKSNSTGRYSHHRARLVHYAFNALSVPVCGTGQPPGVWARELVRAWRACFRVG